MAGANAFAANVQFRAGNQNFESTTRSKTVRIQRYDNVTGRSRCIALGLERLPITTSSRLEQLRAQHFELRLVFRELA